MLQKIEQIPVKLGLVKVMVDSQNRAELMRAMAETAEGETQRLYHQLAEAFSLSAQLIEELKLELKSQDAKSREPDQARRQRRVA
jgi:hypothetical protein